MLTASAPSPVNVLVVDQSVEERRVLRQIVEGPGYSIVEAACSRDALAYLGKQHFAVMLVDIVTPELDGFELAEHIRAHEHTQSVPILFVAPEAADASQIARGYRVGAADYLVKPLVPEIVRAKVAVFAEIDRQRMLVEASLREKEVLLREIHHRVKNNLQIISSLLNLQASRQSDDVRRLFVETNARVRSIALVHEQLHRAANFAAIDIHHYLTALTLGLVQTYGSLRTEVSVQATSTALTIDVAIPCGLIVNELVSNALRHAFPDEVSGKLVVTLTEQPDSFVLEVCDDGVGIPAQIDTDQPKTMGLQLVRSLAHQLRGTITFERTKGTRVRITFPKPSS